MIEIKLNKCSEDAGLSGDKSGPESPPEFHRSCPREGLLGIKLITLCTANQRLCIVEDTTASTNQLVLLQLWNGGLMIGSWNRILNRLDRRLRKFYLFSRLNKTRGIMLSRTQLNIERSIDNLIHIRNHAQRGNHQEYARMTFLNPQRHVISTAVLTKSKLVPITAARLVTAVVLKPHVTRPRQAKTVITKPHSPPSRTINRRPSPNPSNFLHKVTTAKALQGNPQHALKDKGVIDSGCSREEEQHDTHLLSGTYHM
nr:hypothetical protein [Tanacetum cinerariifolium]